MTYHDKYHLYSQILGALAIFFLGIGWFLFSFRTTTVVIIDNFTSIVMTSAYGFFFVGMMFRYSFPAGLFINIIYSIAIWTVADMPTIMKTSVNTSMIVIFFLLAMAAYQKELVSRQLFVSERRERNALARQSQSDRRYLDWLRQLAQFLRHEVRQPVAQINSSIELIQLASGKDDVLQRHLAGAALGAQHVWNLIDRASRATDAEAFVRQGRPQEVMLDILLTEVVEGFRRTYSGIDFSFQTEGSIVGYVDPTLIREAVVNLLNNAASFAEENSIVEVKLEKVDTQAIIRVINHGPLISGDAEALFGPFKSSRSGLASEHPGLGLYLVRIIAEYHGGTAAIQNLKTGSGVEAVISLPTRS
jgi:signal transduction histidine kinase